MPVLQSNQTKTGTGVPMYLPSGGPATFAGDLVVDGDLTVSNQLLFPGNNSVQGYNNNEDLLLGTPGDIILDPVGNVKTPSSIYADGTIQSFSNPADPKFPYRASVIACGTATILPLALFTDVSNPATADVVATSKILVSYAGSAVGCGALWVSAYGGGFGIFREIGAALPVDVNWVIVAY